MHFFCSRDILLAATAKTFNTPRFFTQRAQIGPVHADVHVWRGRPLSEHHHIASISRSVSRRPWRVALVHGIAEDRRPAVSIGAMNWPIFVRSPSHTNPSTLHDKIYFRNLSLGPGILAPYDPHISRRSIEQVFRSVNLGTLARSPT